VVRQLHKTGFNIADMFVGVEHVGHLQFRFRKSKIYHVADIGNVERKVTPLRRSADCFI